jgi:hypothetical protein
MFELAGDAGEVVYTVGPLMQGQLWRRRASLVPSAVITHGVVGDRRPGSGTIFRETAAVWMFSVVW